MSVTVSTFQTMKQKGEKISMITASSAIPSAT